MIRRGIGVQSYVAAGGAAPFVGLLDTYTDAAVAYSVRKLRNAYSGSAIRVRRSSDNTEQDIGFDTNGNLDESALTTFVGAGNGFVTTWYDQSGNSRNATQSTAINQPLIVNAGTVEKTNGKVSIKFDASNDVLINSTSIFSGAGNRTLFALYKPNNASGTFSYSIFGQTDTATSGYWSQIQSRTRFVTGDPYFAGFSADIGNGLSTPDTTQKLGSFFYNGTSGSLYKNNSLLGSANITLNAQATGQIYIGASTATNEFADANIQELIAWASNKTTDRTGISDNINTYFSIY